MVNVTKENFIEQSNDLLKHLPEASFIAIDEEMTGISFESAGRPRKDIPPSKQYESLKRVPETYNILQLGVALFFKNTEEGSVHEWTSRRYNFYCFPRKSTRPIVMSPSAVEFLQGHGMDWNTWANGVSYQFGEDAVNTLQGYIEKERAKQDEKPSPPTVQDTVRRGVVLNRAEDVDFHARAMASLREWLDTNDSTHSVEVPEGVAMLLPACNSFLRRALYESIQQNYPSLETETVNGQIRVVRLDAGEKRQRQDRLAREGWEETLQTIGMWRILEAISRVCRGQTLDSSSLVFSSSLDGVDWRQDAQGLGSATEKSSDCVPLIVHNGFMDLAFLMTHFHQLHLPPTLEACKQMIRSYFPIVFDTKVLACEGSRNQGSTTLGTLHQRFGSDPVELLESSGTSDQEHEAAFDAWMTGCVYVGLCNEIGKGRTERIDYCRNKLYQMSMYTMDLEQSEDPLVHGMHPETTFRVSGIDPSVSTRDIVRCLHGLTDDAGNRVNYEIIWIDHVSFLVATTMAALDVSTVDLQTQHGEIVRQALSARFDRKEKIVLLAQTTKEAEDGFWSRWFGWAFKRKATNDNDEERPAKRRRT